MSTPNRLAVLGVLVLAVALVFALKRDRTTGDVAAAGSPRPDTVAPGADAPRAQGTAAATSGTPRSSNSERDAPTRPAMPAVSAASADARKAVDVALPRLVDVGADTCIPCKAMAPILEDLRREYAGRLRVDFIDAWKYPDQAAPFNVYGIPTQIFFDPSGRELHRHLGFISKDDILATWRRLGFPLTPVEKG